MYLFFCMYGLPKNGRDVNEGMRKSALKGSLALLLSLTSAVALPIGARAAESSADFADLQDVDAATKAKLDALISAGVFNGVSDDTFGLDQPLTRAQLAKVITLTMGLDADSQVAASSFTDVDGDEGDHWALGYIEAVRNAGIMEGMGDGKFGPSVDVTKEQLAAVLVRALGIDVQSEQGVRDESVSEWAGKYVAAAVNRGLIPNDPDGTFGGSETATRDQVVAGSYETAQTLEASKPLAVSGADFAEGNTLELTLTAAIDGSSVDLSNITINGVPLDPKLDSFTLSDDKKTIIVKLHQGFTIDTSKTPGISVSGLKTVFGNLVQEPTASNPIPVTVTTPPVGSTSSVVATTPSTPSTPSEPSEPSNPPPSAEQTPAPTVELSVVDSHSAFFDASMSVTGVVYYTALPVSEQPPEIAEIHAAISWPVYSVESPIQLFVGNLLPATEYVLYVYEQADDGSAPSVIVRLPFETTGSSETPTSNPDVGPEQDLPDNPDVGEPNPEQNLPDIPG